jgi:hypothetical protein
MLDHSVEIAIFPAVEYTPTVDMAAPSYDPDRFLDAIIKHMRLKNDAALSRALDVAPPVVSKLRHRAIAIGATHLLRAHEATGMTIAELKALAGLPAFVRREC